MIIGLSNGLPANSVPSSLGLVETQILVERRNYISAAL